MSRNLLTPAILLVCSCATPKPHWEYDGEAGPDHWGEVDPTYEKCATGEHQSPVDLGEGDKQSLAKLRWDYQPDDLEITNNGHTVQVAHDAQSKLWVDDKEFRLVQYHFHSPSEHTIQRDGHVLEIHLVHVDGKGNYAVLGVFVDGGVEREGSAQVWAHLPPDEDQTETVQAKVDPSALLPPAHEHFQYSGSLTTPPCTETVTWLVMEEPIPLSNEHIDAFRKLYNANARPTQPRPDWCLAPHEPPQMSTPAR